MNGWDLDTGKIINMKQNRLGTESLRTSSASSMCVCGMCVSRLHFTRGNIHLVFKTKHLSLQETMDFSMCSFITFTYSGLNNIKDMGLFHFKKSIYYQNIIS